MATINGQVYPLVCDNKAMWRRIEVSKGDLQLVPTLNGGQSFRWKNVKSGEWIGVFREKVWVLSQADDFILFKCFYKKSGEGKDKCGDESVEENELKSYLRLDVDLKKHYEKWAERDVFFRETAPKFYGIRILNQDVTENIFSFICSANNHIKRISSMIEKLCNLYGDEITELDNEKYYSFPSADKLACPFVESDLRKAGFGYRAKFIYKSACEIKNLGGDLWLENLKCLPYNEAKLELMRLPGIGAKVADCICLMSLGHLEAVPVDTHILQVATAKYLPHLKQTKSLTTKVYNEIADHFRKIHGEYAGWANTILFCSDLKQFRNEEEELKKRKK